MDFTSDCRRIKQLTATRKYIKSTIQPGQDLPQFVSFPFQAGAQISN